MVEFYQLSITQIGSICQFELDQTQEEVWLIQCKVSDHQSTFNPAVSSDSHLLSLQSRLATHGHFVPINFGNCNSLRTSFQTFSRGHGGKEETRERSGQSWL